VVDKWLSIVVGLAVLGAAVWLFVGQQRGFQVDPADSDNERRLLKSQHRRRLQVAVLLGLVGLMIAVGDGGFIPWERHVVAFALYWLVVIGLTLWLVLLTLADLLIHRLMARSAAGSLARLEQKRAELLTAVERLKEHEQARNPRPN
jgi:hypothetical protein